MGTYYCLAADLDPVAHDQRTFRVLLALPGKSTKNDVFADFVIPNAERGGTRGRA